MKKVIGTIVLFVAILFSNVYAQRANTWQNTQALESGVLNVQYFENFPYSYSDPLGNLTGIEVDIIREFLNWLKESKGISVNVNFIKNTDFREFYESVKSGNEGIMGIGSVTITQERLKDIKFSPAYLRNQSFLITQGNVPSLKSVNEIPQRFDTLTAVTVKGSSHEAILNRLKANQFPRMRVQNVSSPELVFDLINSGKYFGYADILTYWSYLQKKKKAYLKFHPAATVLNENLAFIFPRNSDWDRAFTEFFESGFGFFATKAYSDILEKHLGYEVISQVKIDAFGK